MKTLTPKPAPAQFVSLWIPPAAPAVAAPVPAPATEPGQKPAKRALAAAAARFSAQLRARQQEFLRRALDRAMPALALAAGALVMGAIVHVGSGWESSAESGPAAKSSLTRPIAEALMGTRDILRKERDLRRRTWEGESPETDASWLVRGPRLPFLTDTGIRWDAERGGADARRQGGVRSLGEPPRQPAQPESAPGHLQDALGAEAPGALPRPEFKTMDSLGAADKNNAAAGGASLGPAFGAGGADSVAGSGPYGGVGRAGAGGGPGGAGGLSGARRFDASSSRGRGASAALAQSQAGAARGLDWQRERQLEALGPGGRAASGGSALAALQHARDYSIAGAGATSSEQQASLTDAGFDGKTPINGFSAPSGGAGGRDFDDEAIIDAPQSLAPDLTAPPLDSGRAVDNPLKDAADKAEQAEKGGMMEKLLGTLADLAAKLFGNKADKKEQDLALMHERCHRLIAEAKAAPPKGRADAKRKAQQFCSQIPGMEKELADLRNAEMANRREAEFRRQNAEKLEEFRQFELRYIRNDKKDGGLGQKEWLR